MRLRLFESLCLASLGSLAACATENPGTPPPPAEFHFPIAAAVSRDSNHLYVVNSDFNLQYNGGRVNVVNLAQVRDALAACPSGVCAPSTTVGAEAAFITDSVLINPFANAAGLRTDASGRARLYVLVRGNGTVTWMDVAANGASLVRPTCQQGVRCPEANRSGDEMSQSARGLTLPSLPVAMTVDDDGYITVVHQEAPGTRNAFFSLFYDDFTDTGPRLTHYVSELPLNQAAVLRVNPGSPPGEQPYWYSFSREQPFVSHVHAFPDGDRSFAYASRIAPIPGVASDLGIRYVTRDPHPGRPRAYATTRPGVPASGQTQHSPEALVDLDLTDPANPLVRNVVELPLGPSQLVAIDAPGPSDHTIVYAVSYDARKIYVVDAEDWREIDQITTELGPNALVPDPSLAPGYVGTVHPYLYLVNFAAMCVEVINVDPASPLRHRVVFTIGDPTRPRANL